MQAGGAPERARRAHLVLCVHRQRELAGHIHKGINGLSGGDAHGACCGVFLLLLAGTAAGCRTAAWGSSGAILVGWGAEGSFVLPGSHMAPTGVGPC